MPDTAPKPAASSAANYDAVIVGGGFAGLYMLHKMRGLGFTARVYEAGDGVGGTWFWNRYPGARVDIQSLEYSYQFDEDLQQQWEWSERYAPQAELLTYANHVADRFDLWPDIQLNTRVTGAHYDEATGLWRVTTDQGDAVTARNVIMATGCLSSANTPNFKGLDPGKYTLSILPAITGLPAIGQPVGSGNLLDGDYDGVALEEGMRRSLQWCVEHGMKF